MRRPNWISKLYPNSNPLNIFRAKSIGLKAESNTRWFFWSQAIMEEYRLLDYYHVAPTLFTWFISFSFVPALRKWQKLARSQPRCQSTFNLTRSKKCGLPSNFQMLKSRYEKNARIEKDKRGKPVHFRQSYFQLFQFDSNTVKNHLN